jgi:hypothetical protein
MQLQLNIDDLFKSQDQSHELDDMSFCSPIPLKRQKLGDLDEMKDDSGLELEMLSGFFNEDWDHDYIDLEI